MATPVSKSSKLGVQTKQLCRAATTAIGFIKQSPYAQQRLVVETKAKLWAQHADGRIDRDCPHEEPGVPQQVKPIKQALFVADDFHHAISSAR